MPNKGYVQTTRLVVNSTSDETAVKQLLSSSVQQCATNFRLSMVMGCVKDHRLYAQVVSGKCDGDYTSHYSVHSDTVKKYVSTTQGQSACYSNTLGLDCSHSGNVCTKTAGKQSKPRSDPDLHEESHVFTSGKVSSKSIANPFRDYVPEHNQILTSNRFAILMDENDSNSDPDSGHSQLQLSDSDGRGHSR